MKKIKTLWLFILNTLWFTPGIALAQKIPITEKKWDIKTITTLISSVINWLGIIAGGFAVIYIVIGGIRYVMASGNPDAAQAAKTSIINAVIGVVIVAAAWGILTLVISLIPK